MSHSSLTSPIDVELRPGKPPVVPVQAPKKHSYSSLQTLARCEKKYAYSYIEGYISARPESPAQLRGNAWHALCQADLLARGARAGSLLHRREALHAPDVVDPAHGSSPRSAALPPSYRRRKGQPTHRAVMT